MCYFFYNGNENTKANTSSDISTQLLSGRARSGISVLKLLSRGLHPLLLAPTCDLIS